MDDLEYRQMREREQAVVNRVHADLGNTATAIISLKDAAHESLRDAERRWYKYASALDVGPERTRAFEIFEHIRIATRQG